LNETKPIKHEEELLISVKQILTSSQAPIRKAKRTYFNKVGLTKRIFGVYYHSITSARSRVPSIRRQGLDEASDDTEKASL